MAGNVAKAFFPNQWLTHRIILTILFPWPYRVALLPAEQCSSHRCDASLSVCRHLMAWKMKEGLLCSWVSSTDSGFKTVSWTVESLITVASLCLLPFMSCLWPQNSRSQCSPRAVGTHCLPVSSDYPSRLKYCWRWLKLQTPVFSAYFWPWEEPFQVHRPSHYQILSCLKPNYSCSPSSSLAGS